jgi:hypothetical protein
MEKIEVALPNVQHMADVSPLSDARSISAL